MTDHALIERHIKRKEAEKLNLHNLLTQCIGLDLKEETFNEVKAKISSRIAQCDKSIEDHKKLRNTISETIKP